MSKKTESIYIGDGVYLSFDGYQLWLAVGDHRNLVVALDEQVFKTLVDKGTNMMYPDRGEKG